MPNQPDTWEDGAPGGEREWGIGDYGSSRGAGFSSRGGTGGERGVGSIEFGGWHPRDPRYVGDHATAHIRVSDRLDARLDRKVKRFLEEN